MATDNRCALWGVVAGGVIGILGSVGAAYLQGDIARQQARTDRGLEAIRAFSTACQRLFSLNHRMNDQVILLLDISDVIRASKTPNVVDPQEAVTYQQMVSLMAEVAEADVAWRVENSVSNAIFGTDFQVPLLPPTEIQTPLPFTAAERKRVQAIIARWEDQERPALARRCTEDTNFLMSRLNR